MRNLAISLVALLILTTGYASSSAAQNKSLSPAALVADLYRQHNRKHSPFFQTKSRALVNKYFEKSLADLIWKDATTSKGEVGALDGDPLYDAQDMDIKKFRIGKSTQQGSKAQVLVTFENFGKPVRIIFRLIKTSAGWRISDIEYAEGHTLLGLLKSSS